MVATRDDVVFSIAKRAHRFEAVPHEKCEACGERVFSLETSQMFDRTLGRRRGHKHAA